MLLPLVLLLAASTSPAEQLQSRIQEGMAAVEKNDLPKARSSFEEATRIAPGNAGAWLMLAQVYGRQKDAKAAMAAAQKAESLGGDDPRILQGLANFYATSEPDLPRAAAFGARYAEKNPVDTTAWRRLGSFCRNSRLLKEAVAAGAKDVELHPYAEEAHFGLAQAYLLQQDFNSAVAVLLNARRTFDKSAQIELTLGVAYYGLRKFPEAVDQFVKTAKLAPDVPQPYVFLDRILDHAGERLPEVTELFAQFEARNPKSPLGYRLHAKALIAQLPPSGDPPEAAAAYALLEKSLALKEDDADAHFQLGVLLDRRKDFAGAATQLERSIQLNAKDSAVHFRLARVYERLGRKDEAAKQRELAEKLSEEENATKSPDKTK
jgi:tetratricopeptide (TPR) repeat protein